MQLFLHSDDYVQDSSICNTQHNAMQHTKQLKNPDNDYVQDSSIGNTQHNNMKHTTQQKIPLIIQQNRTSFNTVDNTTQCKGQNNNTKCLHMTPCNIAEYSTEQLNTM